MLKKSLPALIACLWLSGCGGDSDTSSGASSDATATPTQTAAVEAPAPVDCTDASVEWNETEYGPIQCI